MNLEDIDGSVKSGEFASEFIESRSGSLPEEAIQSHGIDLSINKIYRLEGTAHIKNGEEYTKTERVEVEPENGEYKLLAENGYIVVYDEIITIPENHCGLVLPRSRLMRCGNNVHTAVWDSGYSGIGEGLITLTNDTIYDEDLRLAQIIFIETENLNELYEGSHQGERI